MGKVHELLKEIGDLSFATADGQGNPRIRTIMVMFIENGKLFFTTSRKKKVFRQLENNPHVALNGSTDSGVSVSIHGKIGFSDNPAHMKKIFEAYPPLHDLYKDNPKDLTAFYLEHGEARIFDLSVLPPRSDNFTF
ncbi:MAG: pyridoxamine 5'-phosphate oxidase family protein [Kiritimatiellales bacterium]|nr:pyridoxamine 5'-phosphate oxidase family protein [Kiritimatiellales bacterium]